VAATPEKRLLITFSSNPFAEQFQLRFDETIVGAVQLKVFNLHNGLMHDLTFNAASQHET